MLQTYMDYGSGDVIFKVANPSSTCAGYWLQKSRPGFEATYSMLLAAYLAKKDIRVWGHLGGSYKWPGSNTHLCLLYSVKIES